MWPALFSCQSHRNLRAVNYASCRYWPHCRRCVDDISVTRWSGGSTGLELWTFFQPQSQGIDLYADRGNIRYTKTMQRTLHSETGNTSCMLMCWYHRTNSTGRQSLNYLAAVVLHDWLVGYMGQLWSHSCREQNTTGLLWAEFTLF